MNGYKGKAVPVQRDLESAELHQVELGVARNSITEQVAADWIRRNL